MLEIELTSAYQAAYRHASWRPEVERRDFADFHSARTASTDSRVLANHYGAWMAQR